MSYIKTSEFTSPSDGEPQKGLLIAGATTITIPAPQGISNPTDTAGYIEYRKKNATTAEREYFAPGQVKPYAIGIVYGSGGALGGTTVAAWTVHGQHVAA